jgi:uncharacterized RDD family membrane protein YckC
MSFERQSFSDQLSIETPEQVELRYGVAGIGSRFVAVLVDHLIQLVALVLEILLFVWIGSAVPDSVKDTSMDMAGKWFVAILIFLNFAFFAGYFALFEAYWKGQTPGKRLMKLRVIKDSGRQITFFEALSRNVIRFFELSIPGMYLTAVITMALNKQNKRLGDFVAGTIVVHERVEDQPLLVRPNTSIFSAAAAPLEPWKPIARQMFPADAVTKLDHRDLVVIETFFSRALDLSIELRAHMADRLARQMTSKMGVPLPEGNPERALESIVFLMRGSGRQGW